MKRRYTHPLRNENGSLDLASVMAGVVVVGIMSSVGVGVVGNLVPLVQDTQAQMSLTAVQVAETSAHSQDGTYLGTAGLVAAGLLPAGFTATVETDEGGTCWVAVALSESGDSWVSTSKAKPPAALTADTDTAWCVPAGTFPAVTSQPEGA